MRMTLLIHILAGGIGLATGYVALFASKGGKVHRKSGMLFVYSMLVMALLGALIAALTNVEGSVVGGLITAYMVVTALTAVRPPARGARALHAAMMAIGLAIGAISLTWGVETLSMPRAARDGIPAAMFLLFGTIAILSSLSDIRMLLPAGVQGAARLRRHLWRMCYALWMAAASFFLGQADEFPDAIRKSGMLAIPVVLVLGVMIYWLIRVRPSSGLRPPSPRQVGRRADAATLSGDSVTAFIPLPAWRGEGGRRPGEGRNRGTVP